jgi:hypothetical protein
MEGEEEGEGIVLIDGLGMAVMMMAMAMRKEEISTRSIPHLLRLPLLELAKNYRGTNVLHPGGTSRCSFHSIPIPIPKPLLFIH